MDQVVDRAVAREHELVKYLSQRTPVVETYLQNLQQDPQLGPIPQDDRYFLGRMDLSDSIDRSDFLGEIQAFGADQSFVNVRGESVTDFQLGYQFESGKYEGLNFLLQVNNLFDTPYRQFYANHSQPEQYTLYGRQILLGVNYKF